MSKQVTDIEVLETIFLICTKDYNTKEERVFEISERRNDLFEIVKFFNNTNLTVIGFNSIHYDQIIIQKLIKDYSKYKNASWNIICKDLREVSDWIIEDGRLDESIHYKKYSKYKYDQPFKSVDLFLYWSKMLRISKKLSLKSLAVWMNHELIQEFNGDESDIDSLIVYCKNDVAITEKLCTKLLPDIKLRVDIEKEYGLQCMSWDNIKIASELLGKLYSQSTGIDLKELKQMRTYRDKIHIKDIILPFIEFKTTKYQDLLTYLKSKVIKDTNEISYRLITNNQDGSILATDIASGGIHGVVNKTIIIPNDTDKLYSIDVASLYPSLIIEHKFAPKHLGNTFLQLYSDIKDKRIKAKKEGNKIVNESFKLVLNGSYGLMNNDYSWLKDLQAVLSITINGELLICKLTEELQIAGMSVLMQNTDGVEVIVPISKEDQFKAVVKSIEEEFKVLFEFNEYTKLIIRDINNYIAIDIKDKIKTKGCFTYEPEIGSSNDFLVIPLALKAFYIDGIDPEVFIRNHDNIYDFCAAKKSDPGFIVTWNNIKQQRLNRYYVSKKGAYLYKQKDGKNLQHLLKDGAVILFNRYEKKEMRDYNLNYEFYINLVRKQIQELRQDYQMQLF